MALRSFGRSAGLLVLGGAGLKAVQITANEDWDDYEYAIKKFSKQVQQNLSLATAAPKGIDVVPKAKPKVVVLGSGWGALSFLQKLDQDKADVIIVSPRSFFFYTPLLAGTVTGTVATSSIVEPIRWYCERAGHDGAHFIQAECTSVDMKSKVIKCRTNSGPPNLTLEYDYLIVAVGAEPNTFNIPGVREYTSFIKEVEDAAYIQKQLLQRLELASALVAAGAPEEDIRLLLSWVVIGGGPTGVELTAELTDFIKQEVATYFPTLVPKIRLTLLEATDRVLGVFDRKLSAFAQQMLSQRGANVLCNAAVSKVTPDKIEYKIKTAKGVTVETMPHGVCVWAGGIARRPFVEEMAKTIGKVQASRFGLVVDETLRVKGVSDGSVFAIGDCAVSGCAPTAQAAYQQGKYLGRMFRDTQLLARTNTPTTSSGTPSVGTVPAVAAASGGGGGFWGLGASAAQKPGVTGATGTAAAALGPGVAYPAFKYDHKGSLAYTGGGKGVAELKSLWDNYPSDDGTVRVEGTGAFAIWRSLYFSKLMSARNMSQVLFDWSKVAVFGRDISSPYSPFAGDRDKGKGAGKK